MDMVVERTSQKRNNSRNADISKYIRANYIEAMVDKMKNNKYHCCRRSDETENQIINDDSNRA